MATANLPPDQRLLFKKIRGARPPKNQDRLKHLLPDDSAGGLGVIKMLSLNLNFSFLSQISLLLNQVAIQLSSRGWVNPVSDPILPEKLLGYSQESNPRPLGWKSDTLTNLPNRWSKDLNVSFKSDKSNLFCLCTCARLLLEKQNFSFPP